MPLTRCSTCGHALYPDLGASHSDTTTTVWLSPLGPQRMREVYVGYHDPTSDHRPRGTCWCERCVRDRRVEIAEHYLLLTDDEIDGDPTAHRTHWADKLRKAIADASSSSDPS